MANQCGLWPETIFFGQFYFRAYRDRTKAINPSGLGFGVFYIFAQVLGDESKLKVLIYTILDQCGVISNIGYFDLLILFMFKKKPVST